MDITEISTDSIMEFTRCVLVVQRDFHAFITDVPHILNQSSSITHMGRSIDIHQGIQSITTEVINSTAQFSVPETEVNTRIPLLIGLPLTGGINLRQHGSADCHILSKP